MKNHLTDLTWEEFQTYYNIKEMKGSEREEKRGIGCLRGGLDRNVGRKVICSKLSFTNLNPKSITLSTTFILIITAGQNSGGLDGEEPRPTLGAPASSDASVARAFNILKAATAKWINDVEARSKCVCVCV